MITSVKLAHGSGRGLNELLRTIVLPVLSEDASAILEDSALMKLPSGTLAFTTDSFVVSPLEFSGGNIGKLAACGTINDLAMMGAVPIAVSVALILEEGLDTELLVRVLRTLRAECTAAGVAIRCGDTKVVDKGKADGMFITTSGIGQVPAGRSLSVANARPGDAVLVSGPIGSHGIAILVARKGLGFASTVISDCACLHPLVEELLAAAPDTRSLRDATRGGCAAVLNEMADASGVSFMIRQSDIPVSPEVSSACAFLGLDPLQVANEGRFIAVVPPGEASVALDALRSHELGRQAAIIGRVTDKGKYPVIMETLIGGTRLVDVPPGELLPRIC
ncbi:MAG: hydrogenase expression/formation protein HypE [Chitinispirillaceae bacterium]|jgi:hydrogenase expression/formation protein HypE|nr:hydrogenase expression/formation protein HypE [Chitinispirillaceae bacterium]